MPEQQMSDSYHRARRMFALLCGILISWEYIGIEIGTHSFDNKLSPNNLSLTDSTLISENFDTSLDKLNQNAFHVNNESETPNDSTILITDIIYPKSELTQTTSEEINNTKGVTGITPGIALPITLRSPEVIPTIIFILVLYFSFRFSIEWIQSPIPIRKKLSSSIDATVSYLIGLVAIIIFGLQNLSRFRLSELFEISTITSFFIGIVLTTAVGTMVLTMFKRRGSYSLFPFLITVAIIISISLFLVYILKSSSIKIAAISGSFIGLIPRLLFLTFSRKKTI